MMVSNTSSKMYQEFLDSLYKRRMKLASVLVDEEYSGIREIVEELYPDRAHFIYELLQNAEDVGAEEAKFILNHDGLVFEHDKGRAFNNVDVERITNIGKKSEEKDKIGRFGIGFKAVFAYTDTPYIWSPVHSFKIKDLVLPSRIQVRPELGTKTRFEFPFNNTKKSAKKAFEEINAGLGELADTTLLFLPNLKSISWSIAESKSGSVVRIEHSDHHIEVLKKKSDNSVSSSHFLRFMDKVIGLEKQYVAIAFEMSFLPKVQAFESTKPLVEQMKIISADPGRVAISFPADKETSGLHFHLHAPFVPELSRASVKNTPANAPLYDQLSKLTVSSLYEIRKLNLLTAEFLEVLPNEYDQIPDQYKPIRSTIIERMKNEALTPTYSRKHQPAKHLLQSKASIKELITDNDLKFLLGSSEDPKIWTVNVSQKNSRLDRFLSSLEIGNWGVEDLIKLLEDKACPKYKYVLSESKSIKLPDETFTSWLSSKSLEWHQHLYAFLYKNFSEELDLKKKAIVNKLKPLHIVRLSNGNYSTGSGSFFPDANTENHNDLPQVDKRVFSAGKNRTQQEDARRFLEEIGVQHIGEYNLVELILKKRYSYEAEIPDDEVYFKDLRRFIKLLASEPESAKMFSEYYIFKALSDEWVKPQYIFLDTPYVDTGLSSYYGALNDKFEVEALSLSYLNCDIELEGLTRFAKAVGAHTQLRIVTTICRDNPEWDYLRKAPGERNTSPIDKDYHVPYLRELLEKPNENLSKLVWCTMCSLPRNSDYLFAKYRKNMTNGTRIGNSQLIHTLQNSSWVPQAGDNFVKPSDASHELLPKDFRFDPEQDWVKKVNFGINAQKENEKHISLNIKAKEIGFSSIEEANTMLKIAKLCKQSGKNPDELISQLSEKRKEHTPEFPSKISVDPKRRDQKIKEGMRDVPPIEHVHRWRSVKMNEATKYTRIWLESNYTNEMDEMVCQICKQEMPFKKRDGKYYFEAVEVVNTEHLAKEHESLFVALCPLCAAKYKEFIKRDSQATQQLKMNLLQSDHSEIPIKLEDNTETTIKFVDIHFHDLQIVLQEQGVSK